MEHRAEVSTDTPYNEVDCVIEGGRIRPTQNNPRVESGKKYLRTYVRVFVPWEPDCGAKIPPDPSPSDTSIVSLIHPNGRKQVGGMHHQRSVGPRPGQEGGTDEGAAPGVRRARNQAGGRLPRGAAGAGPRRAPQPQRRVHQARLRRDAPCGRLPAHEALHGLAPGVPRPHLQLGRHHGLGGSPRVRLLGARVAAIRRGRVLDPRVRHALRPPGQGGRQTPGHQVHRSPLR